MPNKVSVVYLASYNFYTNKNITYLLANDHRFEIRYKNMAQKYVNECHGFTHFAKLL